MQIVVDQERVETVLGSLLETYSAGDFVYGMPSTMLPQEAADLPPYLKTGSQDHAVFLFWLCAYMRGGIKSNAAAKMLAQLYRRRPKLFDTSEIIKVKPSSITASLERVGLRYRKNMAPLEWLENTDRLNTWYDGDPRNIFEGVDDYDEVCRRICNKSKRHSRTKEFTHRQGFTGFQEKMASMIMYFYTTAGIIDPMPFPVPIDFHVMRVCIETEIVTFPGASRGQNVYSKELLAVLRDVFFNYVVRHGVSPVELCNAVWLLSSYGCVKNPGNKTLSRQYRARKTETPAYTPIWSENELQQYHTFCGSCPISTHCRHDVPNGTYTLTGQISILRARSRPDIAVSAA